MNDFRVRHILSLLVIDSESSEWTWIDSEFSVAGPTQGLNSECLSHTLASPDKIDDGWLALLVKWLPWRSLLSSAPISSGLLFRTSYNLVYALAENGPALQSPSCSKSCTSALASSMYSTANVLIIGNCRADILACTNPCQKPIENVALNFGRPHRFGRAYQRAFSERLKQDKPNNFKRSNFRQ